MKSLLNLIAIGCALSLTHGAIGQSMSSGVGCFTAQQDPLASHPTITVETGYVGVDRGIRSYLNEIGIEKDIQDTIVRSGPGVPPAAFRTGSDFGGVVEFTEMCDGRATCLWQELDFISGARESDLGIQILIDFYHAKEGDEFSKDSMPGFADGYLGTAMAIISVHDIPVRINDLSCFYANGGE